jgi:hypothetical protein
MMELWLPTKRLRADIAEDLPACPRCGAPARRVEGIRQGFSENDGDGLIDHEGRIECSAGSGACYYTRWFTFPDSYHYGLVGRDRRAGGATYSEQWSVIDSDWRRLCGSFEERRQYRRELETRRCACGKVPRSGWNYCPNCGRKVDA